MRPLIGIPQCLDDRGRIRAGRDVQYLDTSYARAVCAADATPLYLPLQADARALIDAIDGLLLPGGDDLLPERPYPPGVQFDPVSERQLAFDRQLLDAALAAGRPVLSICYGMQLLALQLGGALHYDIPTDVCSAGAHRLPERDGRHAIAVAPGTRLAAILGDAECAVNSMHHQAVAEPGPRLRVCAVADDGLIEAVEDPEARFAVGVQWHPEKMEGAHRERLFRAFVEACR
ncbi:MAG: gamma-glutamyl-gamma-aminobutyrate hydrolase family protein [Myxococcales bacterium]|nr:gamma-glutamyl-gamma-aminobutyrate hydrolase family protein [Myxococcales bacterium]MDH5307094.1 gamma-glutamyl-gamma-aminobutyrate hydrolase family protein [Myxococcales bacterium]MDH5565061.1 gamma-glutamyl-gamma-aminobutyrate hydrolase family protein [Myxococcales bacterium]